MKPQLLKSTIVSLRPIESRDLPLMYKLENDTTMWDSTAMVQPMSRSAVSRFIDAATGDIYVDHQLRLVIEDEQTLASVGFIDLTDFSPRHQRAEVGLAVLTEYQGRGLGREALKLVEQYAAQMLLIHQLYAYVSPNNERSVRLFAHAGYRQVGLLDDWQQTSEGYKPIILYQKLL